MKAQKSIAVEELDRESNTRSQFPKWISIFITVIAAGIAIFHLYTSYAGALVDIKQRSIHLFGSDGYRLFALSIFKEKKDG